MRRKKTIAIIIIILALVLIMNPRSLEYFNTKLVNSKSDMVILKEIELPHSSQIAYEKFNNGVLQYWDGILYFHDMSGQQIWTLHLGVINPILKTSGNSIYVVDNNKKQITRVSKDGELVYKSIIERNIYDFSVNNSEYVLLHQIQENTPYRYLLLLNGEGKKTNEIVLSDVEIMKAKVDSSNQILIHTISTVNNKIENNLQQYDIKGKLLSLDSLEDKLLLDFYYESRGNLILVFEDGIKAVDKNKGIKWETKTEPIKIIHKQIGEYIALYNSDSKKSGIVYGKSPEKLKVINEGGSTLSESILKERPIGIDSNKNEIIYYSNRSLYIGNKKGEWTTEYKYNSDIEKAFIYPQKYVIVITKERLTFLKF